MLAEPLLNDGPSFNLSDNEGFSLLHACYMLMWASYYMFQIVCVLLQEFGNIPNLQVIAPVQGGGAAFRSGGGFRRN